MNMLARQGQRLLQIGVGLLLFASFEGFVIPHFAAPRLGLSAHTLSALQSVLLLAAAGVARGSQMQEGAIKVAAYSSAPTGIVSFALIFWGLGVRNVRGRISG